MSRVLLILILSLTPMVYASPMEDFEVICRLKYTTPDGTERPEAQVSRRFSRTAGSCEQMTVSARLSLMVCAGPWSATTANGQVHPLVFVELLDQDFLRQYGRTAPEGATAAMSIAGHPARIEYRVAGAFEGLKAQCVVGR